VFRKLNTSTDSAKWPDAHMLAATGWTSAHKRQAVRACQRR
jgi:hypothetical protein